MKKQNKTKKTCCNQSARISNKKADMKRNEEKKKNTDLRLEDGDARITPKISPIDCLRMSGAIEASARHFDVKFKNNYK